MAAVRKTLRAAADEVQEFMADPAVGFRFWFRTSVDAKATKGGGVSVAAPDLATVLPQIPGELKAELAIASTVLSSGTTTGMIRSSCVASSSICCSFRVSPNHPHNFAASDSGDQAPGYRSSEVVYSVGVCARAGHVV